MDFVQGHPSLAFPSFYLTNAMDSIFPSNRDTLRLTPTPQTTLLLPNLSVIAWAQQGWGRPLGGHLPAVSVISAAAESQEKPH